jgi:kynureninase
VSYDIFDEVGMEALRRKSELLTGYLEFLIDEALGARKEPRPGDAFEVITPREPSQRGCQLSLLFHENARSVLGALHEAGVICDFREPNVIRVAPVPLYNSFHELWRFVEVLRRVTAVRRG